MPAVDALVAAIRAALDRTHRLASEIKASGESAAEGRDQVSALCIERSADHLGTAVDRLDEGAAQARSIAERLETALAAAEAARNGARGSTGRGVRPGPPGPEPLRGWDSAADLATARDGMSRLGEVSPGRRAHILDGDGDGESGGHRWDSAIPDKTKFPREWDDDRIIREISGVALRPDKTPAARRRGGWVCEGTRDGVTIEVVINRDGRVWTGYPLRGRGVERNPGEW